MSLAEMEKTIDESLGNKEERRHLFREIVRCLDSDFDVPLRHDRCLGLLALLGMTQPPSSDEIDGLTGYVGASTCRIVRADVHYRYLEALETIADSKPEAERLQHLVERGTDTDEMCLAAYVLARWLDATAKMEFRLGDYTAARLGFANAIRIAGDAKHDSALLDLQSNFLRAKFEERRTANASLESHEQKAANAPLLPELCLEYEKLKSEVLSHAREAGLPEPEQWVGSLRSLGPQQRELFRGLSNLLHNYAIALEGVTQIDQSLAESALSERICRGLGDDYRLAQTLLHQGRILCDTKNKLIEAEARFNELIHSNWGRGKRIARQWLGYISGKKGDIEGAARQFGELFDAFAADRKRRGAEIGSDVPFQMFTVSLFEKVLAQPEAKQRAEHADWIAQARMEKLRVARSLRRVVKAGTYKRDYAKHVEPQYLREIKMQLAAIEHVPDEALRRKRDDSILLLIEEITGRELLDMIAANAAESGDAFEEVVSAVISRKPVVSDKTAAEAIEPDRIVDIEVAPPVAEEGARRSARRDVPLTAEMIKKIEERLDAYAHSALDIPVGSVAIKSDIAHDVRMFTAADERRVVVRFFYAGEKEDEKQLRAYVFRGGRGFLSEPLPIERVRTIASGWERDGGPSVKLAEAMFENLLKPLWKEMGPINTNTHLVLIPSGELLGLPLHVALGEETGMLPLAAATQLCFSVSATAHIARSRHLLGRFPVEHGDELVAFMKLDGRSTGAELIHLGWPAPHLLIFGDVPRGLPSAAYTHVEAREFDALERLADVRPEFFLYSGHGRFDKKNRALGPLLEFGDLVFTQFDVAQKVKLPRNKLTLLAACVTGRGVDADGGEVGGLLRAFMAAGSGAIGITLWDVLDDIMVSVGRTLLSGALKKSARGVFDVVEEIQQLYADSCKAYETTEARIEACPLALYL